MNRNLENSLLSNCVERMQSYTEKRDENLLKLHDNKINANQMISLDFVVKLSLPCYD